MTLFGDTSALMKLLVSEAQSDPMEQISSRAEHWKRWGVGGAMGLIDQAREMGFGLMHGHDPHGDSCDRLGWSRCGPG